MYIEIRKRLEIYFRPIHFVVVVYTGLKFCIFGWIGYRNGWDMCINLSYYLFCRYYADFNTLFDIIYLYLEYSVTNID